MVPGLHHGVTRLHDAPAGLPAKVERELLRRVMIGAESPFQHEAPAILQRQAADLRHRGLGCAGQYLLQDLVEVQRRGRGLQRLLQVAQLPDAALVLLVQLGVAHRNDTLVAKGRQDALIVGAPFAFLVVKDGERPPELSFFEHRSADRGLQTARGEVGRGGEVLVGVEVLHGGRPPAQHGGAHDALSVLKLGSLEACRETDRHDRGLVPLFRGPRQKAGRAVDDTNRSFERLLFQDPGALRDRGQCCGDLAERVQRRVQTGGLTRHESCVPSPAQT